MSSTSFAAASLPTEFTATVTLQLLPAAAPTDPSASAAALYLLLRTNRDQSVASLVPARSLFGPLYLPSALSRFCPSTGSYVPVPTSVAADTGCADDQLIDDGGKTVQGSSAVNVGLIVGPVVGGVALIALIAVTFWYCVYVRPYRHIRPAETLTPRGDGAGAGAGADAGADAGAASEMSSPKHPLIVVSEAVGVGATGLTSPIAGSARGMPLATPSGVALNVFSPAAGAPHRGAPTGYCPPPSPPSPRLPTSRRRVSVCVLCTYLL